jgi:hypothetical protein
MSGLQELIATMATTAGPRVLATFLRPGADGPGPVLRTLPEAVPEGLRDCFREVLAGGAVRILELAPGPELAALLAGAEPCLASGFGGGALVLLERLVPGKLPPWLHGAVHAQRRGGVAVLATVVAREGEAPAEPGERFVYDHHNHGLLPMDGAFSLELHRACERSRAEARALSAGFSFAAGSLQVALEPLPAAVAAP